MNERTTAPGTSGAHRGPAATLDYGTGPDADPDPERPCAFEAFVNVVGTLLVVATVLLLLIDRVRPIFLANP